MIVDEMHEEHPELLKDQYWEEVVPRELPYTLASEHYRRDEPKGSAQNYRVKESDAESVDTPLVERRKNWFQRQLHRMGSSRSSSTAYSSGLFRGGGGGGGRTRNTSLSGNLYSTTNETGPAMPSVTSQHHLQASANHAAHKLSFYERIMHRKSGRGQLNRAIGRQ
ncbi:UNVERIFIED_CONTAM: hypothetical protein B566_EDAN019196, partial [Ephemera danica]